MTKVVLLAALEIRYKVMHVHVVGLERSPRAEMEVADAVVGHYQRQIAPTTNSTLQ